MDRLSKWATTGSLAWLAMAVGLILGTHGGSVQGAQAAGTEAAPEAVTCPETPVAAAPASADFSDHKRS
ncbi:MAG: hypothetical protein OXI39_02910 [Gemmatimonadota bacterium]|uniref:hypothetical protein n=1 Tax=Candidatus Palauibacter scopulicola TaxID=3056741 RepID=UPI00239BB6A7|nr:hypothetical protein [Candidatus Palauibacter scopulicola]MDE2661943.1 hypothetical protein [Candidatus Palauibacter scopulicola]